MRIKNLNDLAKELSKREGKKKQINIAQIKELLACLSDILCEHDRVSLSHMLWSHGEKRSKRTK